MMGQTKEQQTHKPIKFQKASTKSDVANAKRWMKLYEPYFQSSVHVKPYLPGHLYDIKWSKIICYWFGVGRGNVLQ